MDWADLLDQQLAARVAEQIRQRTGHCFLLVCPSMLVLYNTARVIGEELRYSVLALQPRTSDIISIDDVRELISQAVLKTRTPRLAIIQGVDKMTTPAVNALLKTLEEPPADMSFILLTTTYRLPLTILSRSIRYKAEVPIDELRKLLERQPVLKEMNIDAVMEYFDYNPDLLRTFTEGKQMLQLPELVVRILAGDFEALEAAVQQAIAAVTSQEHYRLLLHILKRELANAMRRQLVDKANIKALDVPHIAPGNALEALPDLRQPNIVAYTVFLTQASSVNIYQLNRKIIITSLLTGCYLLGTSSK